MTDVLGLSALVFVLGLKHGFDPDHLVAIDGFTRSTRSRWCGLFFSLGHGLVVTLVGVGVALLAADWQPPQGLAHSLEYTGAWISIGVLVVLGLANLMTVLRSAPGRPVALAGVRSHWLPERLARASHPAVIAAVGAAFALSFDTISHALVFSMTGASLAGWAFAAILGVVFTCGMALTDAVSGLWVARLVRSADQRAAAASRIMSFAVAFLCLALAGLGAAKYPPHFAPMLSAASFAVVLGAYLAARRMKGGTRPVLR